MSTPTRLLLVEDERNVAETLIERLSAAGFALTRADSLASARRAIGEGGFQLAVLDVGLPDGSGFELARLLRERAPATAIVFLTAHANAEDRIRDEIRDRAWSADEFPTSRTVDNFIVRLRKLVEVDAADPRVIRSIRGVGYLLTEVHRD